MRIEFVRLHRNYRPGQVVDHPHPGVADTLVRRGIAKLAGAARTAVGLLSGVGADTGPAGKAFETAPTPLKAKTPRQCRQPKPAKVV